MFIDVRYNGFYWWNIDDRPVPSVVFNYDFNTNIEANPIPSLLGRLWDFITFLGPFSGDRPCGESSEFSLQLRPANSFTTDW